jgi:hypothetical protein
MSKLFSGRFDGKAAPTGPQSESARQESNPLCNSARWEKAFPRFQGFLFGGPLSVGQMGKFPIVFHGTSLSGRAT